MSNQIRERSHVFDVKVVQGEMRRDEDATMDERSDTQRQDLERTRDNESGKSFQKYHGEKIDLVRACDEAR